MRYKNFMRLMLLILCVSNIAFSKVLAYESFSLVQENSPQDIVIADFEAVDYGNWQVTGTAFGSGPAQGTLAGQMDVSGFDGHGLVNSFNGGDSSTGKLTSPEFKLERPFINFLIGGGGHIGLTCMNLLVDGEVVRTATGPNTVSGGSEQLEGQTWDVKDYLGKKAVIEIVDMYSDGWGHISVDSISQGYKAKQTIFVDKQKTLSIAKKYLNIPVKNGVAKRLCRIFVDNKIVRELTVELAGENPDFWVYLDVAEFNGEEVTFQIDRCSPDNIAGFDAVFQDDTYPGADTTYKEALRPQVHFSSKRGWINDSNGMVYYAGEYHLFYQHNPYGWNWGNMTWGHAVSPDMLHWQEIGDALHPDELGTMFSGSAVVDVNNDAGFQTGSEKTLISFYTAAGGDNPLSAGKSFSQCLAYSNDKGRTWTKYENNPVVEHIVGGNRDPKVIWHEPSQKWVMVLFLDNNVLAFFTSTDLKSWNKTSELDGFHECPELFELAVDGDQSNKKWVVYGANGDYMIGAFTGTAFVPETDKIRFHYGNCFYASQTFSDMPVSDGRRVQISWAQISMPGMPFNQMMLFPVNLTLHTTSAGIRMFVNPVDEVESLYLQQWSWQNEMVLADTNLLSDVTGELFRIKAQLRPEGASSCKFVIGDAAIEYNVSTGDLTCSGKTAKIPAKNGIVSLDIIVDRMSLEIYAGDGEVYMPNGVNLVSQPDTLGFYSVGGITNVISLDVYKLKSVWPQN